MEQIRSVKITLEVDSNKRSITQTFSNISEMEEWLEENTEIADLVGYFDFPEGEDPV